MDCALCHNANGDGKSDIAKDMQLTLLDWTDPKALSSQSDQQLYDVIRKGKGKMPPEDDSRAKNDEIRDVVMYIRTFAKEGASAPATPDPAPPAATPIPAPAPRCCEGSLESSQASSTNSEPLLIRPPIFSSVQSSSPLCWP